MTVIRMLLPSFNELIQLTGRSKKHKATAHRKKDPPYAKIIMATALKMEQTTAIYSNYYCDVSVNLVQQMQQEPI